MTTTHPEAEITERDGTLVGPYRRPRNLSINVRGSIHDDATAQKLGFRGGTVAGSIHMEQFPPVLVRAFGQRWFETGSLSYESGHAYGLFQRLIRNVTGIAYDDPPALVREKLGPAAKYLDTVRGVGYRFLED